LLPLTGVEGMVVIVMSVDIGQGRTSGPTSELLNKNKIILSKAPVTLSAIRRVPTAFSFFLERGGIAIQNAMFFMKKKSVGVCTAIMAIAQ
jgi:hypothetical protein